MPTLVHEGKAKCVWTTDDPDLYVIEYRDDATAFNGAKHARIEGKGVLNSAISAHLFSMLAAAGVPTHFRELLSPTEQLVDAVGIVPIEVVVRNVVAGSLAQRTGLDEGMRLREPIVEFYYKRDDLGDPLITRAHVKLLGLTDGATLDQMEALGLRINELLQEFLAQRDVLLVDFKLEFGKRADGTLVLADEISPDTCRFWDATTGQKLDKDRFRRDLGDVIEAYSEVLDRVGGTPA